MIASGLFWVLLLILAVQRLGELRVSARHEAALRARGAVEAGAGHFPMEVVAQVVWMVAMVVEVQFLGARPWSLWWVFALLYVAAEALRAWAIATLGERWTVRVLVLPGAPLVTGGPYRWLRHPNYVAVAIETVAAPLIFGAWRSAIVGAVFYGAALAVRLQVEGKALSASVHKIAPIVVLMACLLASESTASMREDRSRWPTQKLLESDIGRADAVLFGTAAGSTTLHTNGTATPSGVLYDLEPMIFVRVTTWLKGGLKDEIVAIGWPQDSAIPEAFRTAKPFSPEVTVLCTLQRRIHPVLMDASMGVNPSEYYLGELVSMNDEGGWDYMGRSGLNKPALMIAGDDALDAHLSRSSFVAVGKFVTRGHRCGWQSEPIWCDQLVIDSVLVGTTSSDTLTIVPLPQPLNLKAQYLFFGNSEADSIRLSRPVLDIKRIVTYKLKGADGSTFEITHVDGMDGTLEEVSREIRKRASKLRR